MDEDDAISIDAREMAPGSAYKDMFNNREDLARIGGLSVGIPGELKGLYELYKLHGSKNLTWQQLIQPVIDLTNNGWIVGEVFDKVLKLYTKTYAPGIFNKQDWSFVYNDETGELLSEGDLMKRPSLSHTLSLVAQNGSDAIFYDSEGPIVKSIVEKIQEKGGILTKSDFSKYKIRVEKALITENFTHDNYKIFTSNGASSGAALAAGLNIMNSFNDLNGFDSTAEDFKPIESHRLIETMKWMASVRSNFGDLNIYSKNQSEIEEHWKRYKKFLKPEWSFEINSKINDNYTLPSWKDYEPAYQANNPHGTAHFSIIDKDNNAVAMTTTINLIFGSSIHDPDTGIILNDQMDDFSIPTSPNAFGLQPSIYNYIEPFKRPLSSSSPTIIINSISNKPDLIIGAAGGSKITTCVVQAIIRNYHYKMDLLNVIAAPRLHHQLLPEIVSIEEPLIKYELVDELIKKGHEIELVPHATAMNGIRYNVQEQCWEAVSDYWRKRGEAYGY
ncbi:hypothetical protein PACTADRAFT_60842 [Pachysolen tannophilus NRRL Y-2460]|uniref:Gamma-glutamyltransferase n=1 Tax=Pachysolen tannophilus NRRL Y-2460 TaxID=669874 RepID=A0A1E4TRX2_PACTA|nr:hypothetical protein PACTADRAFT_60842 [Pachysolen tannophilus NRRL Y-2460]